MGVSGKERLSNASWIYRREYYLRDHLGNVRLTFSDLNNNGVIATPGEILQETHYDPFGWRLEGAYINHAAPDNMYQYNEKENNTDHGLNMLDYGVREDYTGFKKSKITNQKCEVFSGQDSNHFLL